MSDRSLVSRDSPIALLPPTIPLVLVHPGFSVPQIASMVWAHRKATVIIGTLVLALGVLALMMWPRTYTTAVKLMVNYEVNDPLNGKDLPAGQLGSYIATQVELMQTTELLLEVVDRLDLIHNEDYARMYNGRGTLREWVATNVRKGLDITQGHAGSQLIHIQFSARDPDLAARVANTIAEVYEEQDYERAINPPGERTRVYTAQLAELKAKVDAAQQAVTDFHQRNGILDDAKEDVDQALLGTLEQRLVEVQGARREATARAAADPATSDQVLSSNLVQTLQTQLAQEEFDLAEHKDMYTEKHPGLQHLEAQVAGTKRALANVMKTYSANAAATVAKNQQVEEKLQQAVNEQRAKVLKQAELHDVAAKYLLELDSSKLAYKRALDDYDRIRFASAGHYRNISTISRAVPPVLATKPRMLTGLVLCVFAAGVLGFGLPLAFELLNRRVRCRDDIERQYGIPVLAEFSRLPSRAKA